ncbi:extracellular matrix binding protein [Streptococcus pyogenes]|nr:extracellular matrix binding protein [Streptococcus pyogenes]
MLKIRDGMNIIKFNKVKDSYVKITKESIAARYTNKTKPPYSVAFKVNTKSLIKDHDYKITFEQGSIASGITVDYRIGSAFNKTKDDSFNISDESKYASKVTIEGEERGFINRKPGTKTISFRAVEKGTKSLVLLSKVNEKPTKNSEVEFRNFKIIDVTNPSQLEKGVAYVGNRNVELTLKSDDGRTNFEGDEISLFNSKGELLQTVTVTKDQQNPISITLSEDQAKSLKNKEQLKVSIKQKQSKKTSKDFYLEVGIDPKVKAKQQEKLLELDKVKKQIEDSINGDAWLPEKPEGEKPVQNTNKELQLQELNKKYQMAKEAIESATTLEKVTEKYNEYTFEGEKEKYPNSLRNQYTQGDKDKEIEKAKKSLGDLSDKVNGKIEEDKWLSDEVKKKQQQELEARKQKVNDSLKGADSLKSLRETVEKASSKNQKKPESFEDVYVPGNEETEKTKVRDILQKTYQKTEQNIETDPWLSPEQKKAQKENAKARLDAGLKAVETTESLDKLKEVESDFLDKEKAKSIPSQHQAGIPEVARKTFLDNFEKEAKKEIESIKNDVTLTDAEKTTAKAKVEAQLQEAKDKAKESKSFDDLKNIQDKFNSELPHTPGKPLKDQQSDAIAELEKKQQEIEKAIEGDKTLPRDEKEKQIADSKERLKSDTQKVKDAKNADAIKKAFEEGKVDIPQAHIPGDLNKDKEKLLAELKQKADDTEKAIDSDKTLTAKEKEEQKAKTKEELQKATEAVGAIDNREELDKKVPELKKAIEDTHVKGNLEGIKNKAIEDLKKVHDETVAKINGDDTLDKATKEAQVKEADKALAAGKDAITKADDADKVSTAVTEHTPKIKAAHKTGDLKKAQEEANTALDKAAEKEREEINNDITLTAKDKEQQLKEVETALTKAKDNVKAAKTADAINDARDKGVATIDAVHKAGQDLGARKSGQVAKLEEAAKATKDKISADPTLTSKEKEEQSKAVNAELKKAIEAVNAADTADKVDDALGKGVTDIKNQHKSGDPIEARRGLHNKSIDEVAQATKDAITADTTLTEAEKETQRGNVDKEATKAKEELAKAKDADALDKAYGDGVTSIKNQHKSGKGLDVRKEEHKKALEAVAKRVTAEIEADPTLTPEVREQQKAEVQKELELATDKIAEAKDADEADKAYGDGVTAIENAHVIGKGIEARKDLAKKDLAEAAAKTKALIIEDKTLTDDQRKEQLLGVDTEYAKGIENIDAAKDAAGVDKAYSDGVRDILAQYKEGQNLNDRRNAAKEFLLKEADKVTKLINDDPTLTHDQKVDQINKVEQAKLDAIKSVDDAQTADAINDALGKGIENINNQYQHGDGVDVRKATAKGDLEKEAAKVKALIAKDPTLTQADKDKQTAAVDAAKNTAIAAVDKATTADGVNQELGKGITAINKAYRPGEAVKARKEAAKADLEKEAAKVKALITNDPTLTKADKAKQTEAVAKALKAAIAAVDKATTAEGINQELGKGITAINKAYRPGEGVKARKEAAKADLEREAAKVREAIANDPTLTKADKAKQTEAVAKALKAAIAAVDKATTAEGINQELGKGITAINKAYRPGEGVKARKEAAKANLEKVAKETKALISGDRYLSETEKAVQKQAVEQALAKALGQVEAAKTVEAVKLAENLGTVAIRSAYVAGLAKDTDQATAALNEAKQAAIEALKQAAAETLAKITTDAKLTEAQKAEQSENVSLALKTAIATVRSAQSIASVKEAKDKGITAIRAAYVPNKAVAKSSSANHLPKSGDANSIVLVGLGVMSLLLGMVLYSKKKESKD